MIFRAWTLVEAQIMGIDRLSSMIECLRNYLDDDLTNWYSVVYIIASQARSIVVA